jgi:hypothetical protein
MKLYDCPIGTLVKLSAAPSKPISDQHLCEGEVLRLFAIDGQFAYCWDMNGNKVNVAAWAEVELY